MNFMKAKGITSSEIIGVDGNSCVFATAKESKKYVPYVTVNCDCVGVMNCQRFEKTRETLYKLGVEVH